MKKIPKTVETEVSDENIKEYKDSHLTSRLKRTLIAVLDVALFFIANLSIALTDTKTVISADYTNIVFSYTHLVMMSLIILAIHYIFGLYRSVWSFAGTDEIIRGVAAAMVDIAFLFFIDRMLFEQALGYAGHLPFWRYGFGVVINILFVVGQRIGYRIIRRALRFQYIDRDNLHERVMIVGAGFMGNFVIETLRNDGYKGGKPVIAVDDNPAKYKKVINGVRVVGTCNTIPEMVEKYDIDQIILALPSASPARQKELIDLAMKTNAKVKISPSITEMLEEGGNKKVRNVDIADLLSRPEVKLDKKVCRYLIDKTVLVTGGGGSIGAELCTQVARYDPKTIIIFDIYENCAFELQNELREKYGDLIDIKVRIGSVRDMDRLREVFEEFHPDVVFHAAAHKHVPLMEESPCEAVKNNVFGTYNVALAADEFKVPKMVILSTDKAVNPTNVMGCTKRITEIIVQYMNEKSENTEYAAVRFGNVLGSHGSVIPIFKKQIENGGPVKVTHKDITRYFMTIPEAAQLVCQAGGLAKGGEVFVLDMGEPVRIMDLAENLIRLSGFTVDEIGIEITGLRPGEKLYEELALESELATREKTANEKIYVTQPMSIDDGKFEEMLRELSDIDDSNVREKLMKFIPNYKPAD
ncbi:MAG: polysaccharide biosynthesis protein [Ruminococcaceae bacterium]|nr:polysaccharide biosynthesis protein [Oscillospiraceae bacterium]